MAKTIFEQLSGTYTMQGDAYRRSYCPKKNTPSACGDSAVCDI